jgi:hypothetical protein
MSTAVTNLFEFKPYRDNDYKVTVYADKYKQLVKATLYRIVRHSVFEYGASPIAELDRYGSHKHTYIIKVFFYRNEALLDVYRYLFNSVSELFGLPKASVNVLNMGNVVVYEVEVYGLKHVFRQPTTGAMIGWTAVMKNSRAKVLTNLHRFIRFRDIQESVAREIEELWHAVDKACDDMHSIAYNVRRMVRDSDAVKHIDKYLNLCRKARHFIRVVKIDAGGIFTSRYRSAEDIAMALKSWLHRLSQSLEELKQAYTYVTLTS